MPQRVFCAYSVRRPRVPDTVVTVCWKYVSALSPALVSLNGSSVDSDTDRRPYGENSQTLSRCSYPAETEAKT
ncbi:hypothetical protein GO307_03155 [Ralstonia solanacearum]|nr:hypothetical protein [Ralstonia solanacearum]